jgi:hypothetical protein
MVSPQIVMILVSVQQSYVNIACIEVRDIRSVNMEGTG